MSLDFCCNIWVVGPDVDVNKIKAWFYVDLYQYLTVGGSGVIFSWETLGPLVPTEHCLNATAYLLLTMSIPLRP